LQRALFFDVRPAGRTHSEVQARYRPLSLPIIGPPCLPCGYSSVSVAYRARWRLYWRCKSKPGPGRPKVTAEICVSDIQNKMAEWAEIWTVARF